MANSSQPNSPHSQTQSQSHSRFRRHWLRLTVLLVSTVANLAAPNNSFANSAVAKGNSEDSAAVLYTPIPETKSSLAQVKPLPRLTEAQLSYSDATGKVRFARLSNSQATQIATELAPSVRAIVGGNVAQNTAQAFLQQYGALFGVSNAAEQLQLAGQVTDAIKQTHLNYQQVYRGVKVFGGELKVHLNAAGEVQTVNGLILPDLKLNPVATIEATAAIAAALRTVRERPPQSESRSVSDAEPVPLPDTVVLQARQTQLYIYQTRLAEDQPGTAYLAYQVEVVATSGIALREFVYVDAHTGKVIDRMNAINEVLEREVYEPSYAPENRLWHDGDAFPFSGSTATQTLNVNNIISGTGYAYYFFNSTFGRDSFDGAGDFMRSVNNDPTITCPNANWNGFTTNYCDGVTADDIVAHEWAHAYTERTHNLVYSYQAGALNEAYSDIWGEVIDRLDSFGTDAPDLARSENICTTNTASPWLAIRGPEAISGTYTAGLATFGAVLDSEGLTGTITLAEPVQGCTALTNNAAISGTVALIDRGGCTFAIKAKIAQDAGATGVIIANNTTGIFNMSGTDPSIVIPSLLVEQTTGTLIKAQLSLSEVVTGNLYIGFGTENNYRWLIGEDSTAFSGGLRDMYTPMCMGDPGKVSDSAYICTSTDSGGVHTNSGIPNHAFALTVDGGDYNGQSITGIGMTKAAHIYWRAQTVYQTPFTEFADHADALEQACVDLTDQPLMGLSTSETSAGISGEVISAADCQQLSKSIAAVELRAAPTQCSFQPLLAKNTPALCAAGNYPATVYYDGLEGDPTSQWTVQTSMYDPSTPIAPIEWTWANTLPGGRTGSAFFANNFVDNSFACTTGSNVKRQMLLLSPAITLTAGISHVLTFNHYMASEAIYDGGMAAIKVNGGSITLIGRTKFKFNSYNTTLDASNPLPGVYAFTGSDGGSVKGSWGQSQVDVSSFAHAGDVVQLGWVFSADSCGGGQGWYVDDPQISYCAAPNQIDLTLSNDKPYVGQTVVVTATVRDVSGTPLSGVALTGEVTPTVLGTLLPFASTNIAGQSISTFTAGITNAIGSLAVGDGVITNTAALTVSTQGNCLATADNGVTLFETLDASAVQSAVNAANPSATVKVAGYCAGVQTIGGLTQTVYISTALLLQGGYTRGNWLTSSPINNPTVLDAQQQGRVVYGTTTLALSNLNLVNGMSLDNGGGIYGPRVTLTGVTMTQNTALLAGGAVYANGLATLVNSYAYSNSAGGAGGAIYGNDEVSVRTTRLISNVAGTSGGAIEARRTLTSTSSVFSQNSALDQGGGAIHLDDITATARLIITGSTFSNNTALQGYGGAIDVDAANAVTLTNSSFISNSARDGGAMDSDAGFPMTVQNSIFNGNRATEYEGGALWVDGDLSVLGSTFTGNRASLEGGAVANWGNTLVISQSKFISNVATSGGGLAYAGNDGQIVNNLFAHNVATSTQGEALYLDPSGTANVLHNTIVSGTLANGSAIYARNGWVGITNTLVAGHSIGISQTNSVTMAVQNVLFDGVAISHTKQAGGSGIVTLSNLLNGPADFVNPAGDYHLSNTSLAIDRGAATNVNNDFEGQPRSQQGGPDIGMDESPYGIVADLSVSQTASTNTLLPGQAITYSIVVSNLGPQWVSDTVISSVWPVQLVSVLSNTTSDVTVQGDGSWRIDALAAGTQAMVTITAMLDPALSAVQGTFPLTHTVTVNHAADNNLGNNSSETVVMANLPQVSVSDGRVLEGDNGTQSRVFTMTLSQANPNASSSVHYQTQDNTATAGSDYTSASGDVTFAAGQTVQTITVSINGDIDIEPDELFTLTLSNGVGLAIAAPGTATGRIVNDDNVTPITGLSASSDAPTVLGHATGFTASVLAGSDVVYAWDFGDGDLASSANAVHVYASAGVFTATVTASNGAGNVSVSLPVTVTTPEIPPVAPSGLSISGPRNGKIGQQLTFTGTLLVGTEVAFTWLITPTALLSQQVNVPDLSSVVFNHTFTSAGNYTVTVRASNASGVLDYSIPIVISAGMTPRVYLPITMG